MAEVDSVSQKEKITRPLTDKPNIISVLVIIVAVSLILGAGTGYILAQKAIKENKTPPSLSSPKVAQQDTRTFRDFSEGIIKSKPAPKDPNEYLEGTHILERENEVPVALTSSVVDLSKYDGKKVKVYGETQKAVKEGWLMDVGKVEEVK